MTFDQLNELINRGTVGLGLVAIAILLIFIYEELRSRSHKK